MRLRIITKLRLRLLIRWRRISLMIPTSKYLSSMKTLTKCKMLAERSLSMNLNLWLGNKMPQTSKKPFKKKSTELRSSRRKWKRTWKYSLKSSLNNLNCRHNRMLRLKFRKLREGFTMRISNLLRKLCLRDIFLITTKEKKPSSTQKTKVKTETSSFSKRLLSNMNREVFNNKKGSKFLRRRF